jgi:2-polyprenyl-6-methoxyphenol hydroxylase-like FAD-dependent oxidoreductase
MPDLSDIQILIAGGGIGGLTLASFLRRFGFSFELIEKATEWKPIGAGLTLTPNALRVFDRIGLVEDLLEKGNELHTGDVLDEKGGVLTHIDYSYLREKYGFATVGIHRAALHEILIAALGPAPVRTGTTIQSLENSAGGAEVIFSDGTTASYDLVVGADGIHSALRAHCSGAVQPRYAGYAGWSFVVPNTSDFPEKHVINQLGKGRRFGVIPIGGNQLYCWASTHADRQDPALRALDYRGVQQLMADLGGHIPGVLQSLRPDTPLYLGDAEDIDVEQWYRQSVVLLGDAAHAITPNLGMGASMAVEDAWVLTQCLHRANSISDALLAYQLRRKPRVDHVSRLSYMAGAVGQWRSSAARILRDRSLGLLPNALNERNLEQLMMREI